MSKKTENNRNEDSVESDGEMTENVQNTGCEEEPSALSLLKAQLEEEREKAEEYKRKWYSVSAEYDNYRKRTQAQSSAAYQEGKAEAVLKLVPVADTFGYAYDGADEKTKAGIDKIVKNFNSILASLGVEELEIAVGDDFDESTMEAVMNVPCGEGEEVNKVNKVLKKGYRQGGKVIRFAQVIVTV